MAGPVGRGLATVVCILLACVVVVPARTSPSLGKNTVVEVDTAHSPSLSCHIPVIRLHAEDYFHLGQAVGAHFKRQFVEFASNYKALHEKFIPFISTAEGLEVFSALKRNCVEAFPDLVQEIEGLAEGSGVPVEHVWLINLRQEILMFLERNQTLTESGRECSDVLLAGPDAVISAHNEDNSSTFLPGSYVIDAHVESTNEHYISYNYPLHTPGNAFCVNNHGVGFTNNAVFPREVRLDGVGRQLLARVILQQAHDIHDVERILARYKVATGFNLNVGTVATRAAPSSLINIEVAPGTNFTCTHPDPKDVRTQLHFNEYLHHTVDQHADASSEHRLTRALQLVPPLEDAKDALRVLSDVADRQYPIFRNGAPPDHSITMATVVLRYSEGVMDLYCSRPLPGKAAEQRISLHF